MASISSGVDRRLGERGRMQRRTPSGFGAVMLPPPRWPPQLTRAAEHLGADARAARAGTLEALEQQHAGAGAGHEAAGATRSSAARPRSGASL